MVRLHGQYLKVPGKDQLKEKMICDSRKIGFREQPLKSKMIDKKWILRNQPVKLAAANSPKVGFCTCWRAGFCVM